MPYGRRTYGRRTYTRRPRTIVRRSTKRTYRKKAPYRGRKPSTAMMARKAYSLALYNQKVARGSYQTNLQLTSRQLVVTGFTPALFHVVTPTSTEKIWQFLPVSAGSPTYAAQAVSSFEKPSLAQLTNAGGGQGVDGWNQWADANDDVLNGKYYLQTINYTFTVTTNAAMPQAVRYRIDFVKPNTKRGFRAIAAGQMVGLNARNLRLPDCLGSFNGLLFENNRVNPMYFNFVRKPVYFTVRPQQLHDQAGTLTATSSVVQKHIKLKINQVYNPRDLGTTAIDKANSYLSIPEARQMWCVISSDAPGNMNDPTNAPIMAVTRQFSWRDRAGHAA